MCEEKEIEKILKTRYFQDAEGAVKEYLISKDAKRKNQLFEQIIGPALKQLVSGVKRMPKFQKINGITCEEVEENAYFHIVFLLDRFDPEKIGKSGKPVKAYSYFGTCIKNYFLGIKITMDKKIAKHGGILDINEVKTEIPQVKRDFEKFEELKAEIVNILKVIPCKYKFTKNDTIVITNLRYILENWHSLEFQDKNEFMRLLVNYTHLSPNVVATSMKKIKLLTQKNTLNLKVSAKKKKYIDPIEEEEILENLI